MEAPWTLVQMKTEVNGVQDSCIDPSMKCELTATWTGSGSHFDTKGMIGSQTWWQSLIVLADSKCL